MSKILNVCFLGASEVGKSSLINSFQNSFFDEMIPYQPTIENKTTKLYYYQKQLYNVNVFDTSGSFDIIVPDSIKQCDAFVLVYSLSSRNSFDSIPMYKELIKTCFKYSQRINGENAPIILVGNKLDLVLDNNSNYDIDNYYQQKNDQCAFTQTEILELSKYIGLPYIEASSKDIKSVHSIFNLLINTIEFKEKQLKKKRNKYEKQLRDENRNFFQKLLNLKLK